MVTIGKNRKVPVGEVLSIPENTTIPAGYLLCDGSAVSRTTYADLFAVIGTTFGAGDGSTTFNLPKISFPYRAIIYAEV
jgi:microcystin-dependent protein